MSPTTGARNGSWLRTAVVLVVALGAAWFVFRHTDMALVMRSLADIPLTLPFLAVPVILASHVVRAVRWRTLLRPVTDRVTTWSAFSAVMIGYAANTLVPRSGELLRPWVLSRSRGIDLPVAISSVVVERILDVVTLLAGIAAILVVEPDIVSRAIPGFSVALVMTSLVVPIVLLASMIIVIAFTPAGDAIVRRTAAMRGWTARTITGAVHAVVSGTAAFRSTRTWPRLAFDTVFMWFLYVIPLWLVLRTFGVAAVTDFSIVDAAVILVVISIGVTIAPTPGALGVYQGFAQAALVRMYGATNEEGLAFGILAWILNYGVALGVGGLCLLVETRRGLSFSWTSVKADISGAADRERD